MTDVFKIEYLHDDFFQKSFGSVGLSIAISQTFSLVLDLEWLRYDLAWFLKKKIWGWCKYLLSWFWISTLYFRFQELRLLAHELGKEDQRTRKWPEKNAQNQGNQGHCQSEKNRFEQGQQKGKHWNFKFLWKMRVVERWGFLIPLVLVESLGQNVFSLLVYYGDKFPPVKLWIDISALFIWERLRYRTKHWKTTHQCRYHDVCRCLRGAKIHHEDSRRQAKVATWWIVGSTLCFLLNPNWHFLEWTTSGRATKLTWLFSRTVVATNW